MMQRRAREPYARLPLWTIIMDCRVEPGNDGGEVCAAAAGQARLAENVTCATPSASCPGLTRASMMQRRAREPYARSTLWTIIMDCRVKPGNDNGEA
jgi:hypothetical protein